MPLSSNISLVKQNTVEKRSQDFIDYIDENRSAPFKKGSAKSPLYYKNDKAEVRSYHICVVKSKCT